MDYLIRYSQSHMTFRLAEIEAIALVEKLDMQVLSYDDDVRPEAKPPRCRGRLGCPDQARLAWMVSSPAASAES